ncbi:MAG: undecaprenyldiphospho-muramoylpentapeptide beta-N-acetylglucosaminyltransferase [Acidobacteriota bacterium]
MSTKPAHRTFLFAAGGTGGHLFPALAVAEEIRRIDETARCVFVGTEKKIEARVVPMHGYEFRTIWISGFHRRLTVENALFPLKVVRSLWQSFALLRSLKPDVVVGTGGYVCGPVLFAASVLGIPVVIHESNSYPGVTTRMLAGRASEVLTTFDVTRQWLPAGVSPIVIGNPTRRELETVSRKEASASFGLDPGKKTLLVFGGSLGAQSINEALDACVEKLSEEDGIQVIWQTGSYPGAEHFLSHASGMVHVSAFIDGMSAAYAASDLAVCRSGATTLAELTRLGKPAILVPYPHAAANHQELNARALVEAGAARMIEDAKVGAELRAAVTALVNDAEGMETMRRKSRALGKPDAGRMIAERIMHLAGKH